MLPYIEVVDELLLLTQSHRGKATKKSKLSKKQQILNQQTIEIKQVKQIAPLKYSYSSSQMAEFHRLLGVSRDHSSLQWWQLFRSLVHPVGIFFGRIQN